MFFSSSITPARQRILVISRLTLIVWFVDEGLSLVTGAPNYMSVYTTI